MRVAGLIRDLRVASHLALLLAVPACVAQSAGELTLTPSATVQVVAGSGVRGMIGDGGPAKAAQLAAPRGAAYDTAGNLYIADAGNSVVRKVSPDGTISTFAGTGVQGFAGDGGAASKAELDSPSGVAFAPDGSLYIADTGNRRIRVIRADGTIATFAGSGAAGSSGDAGPAVGAKFRRPVAVAVSAAGVVFVADADDFRVRMITPSGMIQAYAGTGKQGSKGVGGKAVDAELDDPTSLAIDATGRLLIGDRRNRRVLAVETDGVLSSVATVSSGLVDGVAVASDTSVLIANSGTHAVMRISGQVAGREAGNGEQAISADGANTASASFDRPAAVSMGPEGDAVVVDRGGRVNVLASPTLTFPATAIGSLATQSVTLSNTGSADITVSSAAMPSGFALDGGSCGALPISLAVGKSCNAVITFSPNAAGKATGTAVFAGSGFLSRSVRLSGTASGPPALTATTTTVEAPATSAQGSSVILTAHVYAAGPGNPTGAVDFFEGAVKLASAALSGGSAVYSVAAPAAGSHSYSAAYSGDAQFAASTSAAVVSVVGVAPQDFIVTAGASSSTDLVAAVGAPALFQFQVAATGPASAQTVTFAVNGAPLNVSVAFDPASVTTGANPQTVLMTVKVLQTGMVGPVGLVVLAVLLPFTLRPRRLGRAALFAFSMLLVGCAGGSKGSGTASKPVAQTMTLVATAKAANGTTTVHTLPLTLTVR